MNNNNVLNENVLSKKLGEVQCKCKVRLLDNETVLLLVNELENSLDSYLYKKVQVGIEANITHYTSVANSYRGVASDAEILNLDSYGEQIDHEIIRDNSRLIINY